MKKEENRLLIIYQSHDNGKNIIHHELIRALGIKLVCNAVIETNSTSCREIKEKCSNPLTYKDIFAHSTEYDNGNDNNDNDYDGTKPTEENHHNETTNI